MMLEHATNASMTEASEFTDWPTDETQLHRSMTWVPWLNNKPLCDLELIYSKWVCPWITLGNKRMPLLSSSHLVAICWRELIQYLFFSSSVAFGLPIPYCQSMIMSVLIKEQQGSLLRTRDKFHLCDKRGYSILMMSHQLSTRNATPQGFTLYGIWTTLLLWNLIWFEGCDQDWMLIWVGMLLWKYLPNLVQICLVDVYPFCQFLPIIMY